MLFQHSTGIIIIFIIILLLAGIVASPERLLGLLKLRLLLGETGPGTLPSRTVWHLLLRGLVTVASLGLEVAWLAAGARADACLFHELAFGREALGATLVEIDVDVVLGSVVEVVALVEVSFVRLLFECGLGDATEIRLQISAEMVATGM